MDESGDAVAVGTFWQEYTTNITTSTVLGSLTGMGIILGSTIVFGLIIYMFRKISKRVSSGKGGI